jgi:aspartate/methionine/tyrosine aminotransferase
MVMEILERAQALEAQGQRVIHMEVGEPDFPPHPDIVRAMKEALDRGAFKYTHSQGDPELREALSRRYRDYYGVSVSPERFLVFPGTSVGLTLLFGAILNPGDKVVMSDPHYSCYPNFVRFFGGEPFLVPVAEEDGFKFNPEALKEALAGVAGIKALLLNSPANPTGQVLEPARLKALAELGLFIVSDEIYHGLNYGAERDRTILEYSPNAAVVGGFSKSFAMTGFRVGYLIVPPEFARPLRTLSQNFVISVNAAAQKAAAHAVLNSWGEVRRTRAIYDERRKLLVEGLRDLGLAVLVEPMGAFYVLANASHVSYDSRALAFEILEKALVGVTPGADFGRGAEGFLRFSYATSADNIREGLRRLAVFLREKECRS